jgi:hypothetical protein
VILLHGSLVDYLFRNWVRRFLRISVVVSLFLAGCASEPPDPVSLASWQHDLETYVWDRGNGDPTVLADLSWDDVHRGFTVMSDPLPQRSTDFIGLLLGHRYIGGQPYFVFLLGSVREGILEDLRPVALQVDNGQFHWSVGLEDDDAMRRYRRWSKMSSGAELQHPAPPPFPQADDSFQIEVDAERILILHLPSGAAWNLRPREAELSVSHAAYSSSSSSLTRPSK